MQVHQKPSSINRNAKALLDNSKIVARLGELQSGHAARHNVTIDRLTTELIEDRELARKNKQPSVAIATTMSIAKLHGLDINKGEIAHTAKIEFLTVYEK